MGFERGHARYMEKLETLKISTVYIREISKCVLEPSFPLFIQECFLF